MMNELEFGGKQKEPDIRRLTDMSDVICDKKWLETAKDQELYYMYRDLYLSLNDRNQFLDQGIRYDITIIPPGMMGREYIKTAGHYHPSPYGEGISYPEIYEVLEGEALYLLQKKDLSDVVAVNADAGDKVLIPPDYGHITINHSNKTLKMANLVARDFSSIYQPYKEKSGGAYYFTKDGFEKNQRWSNVADLRRIDSPTNSQLRILGMSKRDEMYPLIRKPGCLEYLVDPKSHIDLFKDFI
jgi:glucose-6-phosphate isomerase